LTILQRIFFFKENGRTKIITLLARIEFDDRNFSRKKGEGQKIIKKKYTLKNIYGSEQMVVVGAYDFIPQKNHDLQYNST